MKHHKKVGVDANEYCDVLYFNIMKTNVVMKRPLENFEDRIKNLSFIELRNLSLDLNISIDEWFMVLDKMSEVQCEDVEVEDKDEVITVSLEDAISNIVSKCPSNILSMIMTGCNNSQGDNVSEMRFFKTFQGITGIELFLQYGVGKYRIDAVLIDECDNFGEYNVDKATIKKITCFEFDEAHHFSRSNIIKDAERQAKIVWELKDNFDIIEFYRIPESRSNEFLLYAIPYYGNIESSCCGEKLNDFSFAIDMGYIKSFEQLMNEMRKIYHQRNAKF